MQELVDDGAEVPSIDNVQVATADRPRLLEKAYKAETFDRPRNALGMLKSLPGPEMEKLILAHIQVPDGDLRALALRRATAVQGALAKAAPDGAKRLFLLDPRVDGGGGRVELSLKKD